MRELPPLTDDEVAAIGQELAACKFQAKVLLEQLRNVKRHYRNRGPRGLDTMLHSFTETARMLVEDINGWESVNEGDWPAPYEEESAADGPDAWPLWLLPGATVRAEAPGGRLIAVGVLREVTPRGLVFDAPPVGPGDHAGEFFVYHQPIETLRLIRARPEGPLEVVEDA